MKPDLQEDLQDAKEIRQQKEEQKRSSEAMATWKPGQGLSKIKDDKRNVRN